MSTDINDSSTNKIERYVWAMPGIGFDESIGHPSIESAANGNVGIGPRTNDHVLYRVTIEQVEVPEARWWNALQIDDKPILIEESILDGAYIEVVQMDARIERFARFQAYDRDGAIAEARQAWRDLAANLAEGGVE